MPINCCKYGHKVSGEWRAVFWPTKVSKTKNKGISVQEAITIKRFVKECIVVDMDSDIKDICIKLRRKYSLKLPDAIAATARFLNIPLESTDQDFSKIKETDIFFYQR